MANLELSRRLRTGRDSWRARGWARLELEFLEDRLAPATGLIQLGELAFNGTYTQTGSGADPYTFTGTNIELGYTPLSGQDFEPVYTINGTVSFDTAADPQTFQVTNGTFSTATGGPFGPITVWTGSDTFNVEDMVNDGFSLSGNYQTTTYEGLQFTINSIGFGPPPNSNDPDAYTPEVLLRGQLSLFNGELVVAINGDNYVSISETGINLTGFSVGITEQFNLFGIEIEPKNLTFSYNSTENQFEIYGDVEFKLEGGGTSNITASLGNSQNPGLLIQDGEVASVSFGISGDVELGGDSDDDDLIKLQSPENAPLTLAWEGPSVGDGNSFFLSGTGTVILGSSMQASISLGSAGNPGISVINGAFQLNNISLAVGDINFGAFTLKSLRICLSETPDSFQIGGEVYVTIPGNWGLQGELEFNNTGIINISFDITLGEEGIPIGPTGLFVTEIGAGVQNIGEPADFTISGNIGVDYGGQIAIDDKSVTIFSASGQFSVNKDSFDLSGNVGFGTYTETASNGQKTIKNLFGGGSGAIDLDWGDGDYSANFSASFLDDTFSFGGNFSLDSLGNVDVSANADLNVPKGVPLIGGDHIIGGQAVFQWFGPQSTGYLAGWATVLGIDAGFEYDLANFNGDSSDFSIIGNGTVDAIESGENNPSEKVYTYFQSYQVPLGATIGTFQVTWPTVGGTQSVTLTPPAESGQSNAPVTPTTTPTNGITLVSQELTSFTIQAASPTGDADTPLAAGEFTITLTSSVPLTTTFTGTFSYPQPTVAVGALPSAPSGSSITIPITATVDDAFQAETTISVYYDTNNTGYNGRLIATIPFAESTSVVWNFTHQLPKEYYVYAQIKSGSNSTTFTIPSSQSPVYSAYSNGVTPTPPLSGTVKGQDGQAVSGIIVYIDDNGDPGYDAPVFNSQGQQIGGDTTTTTSREGVFVFYSTSTVPAGQNFSVGNVTPNGFLQISPDFNPTPILQQAPASVEFVLERLNIITGTVYADANLNGQQDPGELPYAGQQLYIDLNNNQKLDFGEPTANSSVTGTYTFYNVTPGTTNIVRWHAQTPFIQRTPAPASGETLGSYTVTYAISQQFEERSGNDFGLLRLATINGTVTAYPVVNGQMSSTAVPLAGITVLLQKNGGTVASTTSRGNGSYTFNSVTPGDYTIVQQLPTGYRQVTPQSYDLNYELQTFQTQFPGASSTSPPQILGAYANWTGMVPSSFAAGDFDGDGKTDYVIIGGVLTSVSETETGQPPSLSFFPEVPPVPTTINAAPSFNAYVYSDALNRSNSGSINTVQSAEVYVPELFPLFFSTGAVGAQFVLPVDFYGTGQLDLAVASPNQLSILQNQGDGTFKIGPAPDLDNLFDSYNLYDYPQVTSLARGDFNGDGADEILIAATDKSNEVGLFLVGNPTSSSNTDFPYFIWANNSHFIPNDPINNDPRFAVADINGDDHLDFAVGNTTQGFVVYALGDGTGNFDLYSTNLPALPKADNTTSFGYNSIALADIDGDGLMNAVYSYSTLFGSNQIDEGATFLLFAEWSPEDNNWAFEPKSIQLPSEDAGFYSTDDISLADINGDSLPDLTVLRANYGGFFPLLGIASSPIPSIAYEIAVFLNNGTDTPFAATPTTTLTNTGPTPPPGYPYLAMGNPRMTLGGLSVPDTGALSVWQNLIPLEPGVDVYFAARSPILNVPVSVSDRKDITNVDFVNAQFNQAGGVVYSDSNRNGVQDPGDAGVAGATLYSDTNGNGQYDLGEPTATTNSIGAYSFSNLPQGNHTIRLDTGDSLVATGTPTTGGYSLAVAAPMSSFAAPPDNSQFNFGVAPRLLQDVSAQSTTNESTLTAPAPTQTAAGLAQNLKFRLIGDVPDGATIHPLTGQVSWSPTYAQAPGDYRLLVQAFDLDNPFATEVLPLDIAVRSVPSPERFVGDLYTTFLGRLPDDSGLAYWKSILAAGADREQIVEQIRGSDESLGRIVDDLYQNYLHRTADAAGRAHWIAELQAGANELELAAKILASAEFRQSNSSPESYLVTLYNEVLGRSPSPEEMANWMSLPALTSGYSRNGSIDSVVLALQFLQSREALSRLVDDHYVDFLGRSPSPGERDAWLSHLSSDPSPAALTAAFAASDEFQDRIIGAE